MDILKTFLDILLIITSIALILLVLLHRGKGGGLSSMFGGGMQSSLSGSSVVEKNLDRLTLFVGDDLDGLDRRRRAAARRSAPDAVADAGEVTGGTAAAGRPMKLGSTL